MYDLTQSVELIHKKKMTFVVLDQDIDTGSATGRLIFHIMGTIAEFERELIKERTQEGRERAKLAGVEFGAKETLDEEQKKALAEDCAQGELSKKEIGKKYGISRASVYRIWDTMKTDG